MRLELDYEFLRDAAVPLSHDDLRLGVSLGLISPRVAVAVAEETVRRDPASKSLVELAGLDRDDIPAIRDALHAVDADAADLSPPESVRKWIYLQLRAAYLLRDRLTDPLGIVEQIYADFDYPDAIAGFVRYMPPPPGAPVGEEALYDRWAGFLQREAAEFRG